MRLEKLTVPQIVKKFPTFHGTRRSITTFTSARQLFLPNYINPINVVPFSFYRIRFNIILCDN